MNDEMRPPALPPTGPPTPTGLSAGAGILLSVMWVMTVGLIGLGVYLWVGSQPENPAARGRVYKSTGMVRVNPQLDPYLFSNDQTEPIPMFGSFMDAQVAVIKSRRVIERAMRSDAWQAVRQGTDDTAVAAFSQSLEVTSSGQILFVSFVDNDPRAAMRGVQTTINAYMEIFGERDQLEDAKRLQALEDRRAKLNAERTSINQRIASLAHIYGTDDLALIYQEKFKRLSSLEGEISRIQMEIATLKEASSDGEAKSTANEYTLEQIARSDPKMARLISQREASESHLEMMVKKHGPGHRTVTELEQQIEMLTTDIEERAQEFRKPVKPENNRAEGGGCVTIASLERKLKNLTAWYERDQAFVLDLGRTRLAMDRLQQENAVLAESLVAIESRIDQLEYELAGRARIEVIDPGNWPVEPEGRSGRRLSYFTWALLSVAGGILLLLVTVPLTLMVMRRSYGREG